MALALPFASQATAAGLDDAVARCQAIADRATRLQCFDELPGRAAQEAAPAPVATDTAKVRPSTDQGGQAASQKTVAASRDTVAPRIDEAPKAFEVTRISKTIDDRHIFYLSDGSAWQESSGGSKRFRANSMATIEQSSPLGGTLLASYWMRIDGAKFKVIPLR
ncbi:MAG TPA: hypothetical protein PKE27_12550 [Povalibacter sp.]|uniref:hypothetical protein n=1 Tax=Povalibacter sp. TaxID=1962978 RepID=UPI002BB6DCB8|nr:hypothetical protein [Povalibacter sp.]HMN45404.1 hypothetical protein [Povalibacter sp.]